jgi:hypothetical protein
MAAGRNVAGRNDMAAAQLSSQAGPADKIHAFTMPRARRCSGRPSLAIADILGIITDRMIG